MIDLADGCYWIRDRREKAGAPPFILQKNGRYWDSFGTDDAYSSLPEAFEILGPVAAYKAPPPSMIPPNQEDEAMRIAREIVTTRFADLEKKLPSDVVRCLFFALREAYPEWFEHG